MSEFSENLLKLTEFPFSYSLIGLLTLISGQGGNLDDLSFAKIGPLLIIMGFVATTLSISDPAGAFQRAILTGKNYMFLIALGAQSLLDLRLLGTNIFPMIFPAPYFFAIAYSPDRLKKQKTLGINWESIESLFFHSQDFSLQVNPKGERSFPGLRRDPDEFFREKEKFEVELDKIGRFYIADIRNVLEKLKEQAVKTKWIKVEIDKINALFYFIITLSVFVYAMLILPGLATKLANPFGNLESIRIGIIAFSLIALFIVAYMFISRIKELQQKTLTVFKYLTALGTIKASREQFESIFNDIERYLNEDHWTLADYWVNRIQIDYCELFLDEVKRPKSTTAGTV